MAKFITEYDKKIRLQSFTFENRLVDAIQKNENLEHLLKEAKHIFECGFFTENEYKKLTDINLYKEILK